MAEPLNLTAREVQQVFAEILSHGEDITWDLLPIPDRLMQNQKDILKCKIGEIFNHQFGTSQIGYAISVYIHTYIPSGKYTNGQSLSALFFVVIVKGVTEPKLAETNRSWSLHPVFRCRRCVADRGEGRSRSRDCCMIYVDQSGVYNDWDTYLKQTALPAGVMVTCDRGVYKLIDGQVELKTYLIKEGRSPSEWIAGFSPRNDCYLTSEGLTAALESPELHRIYSEQTARCILRVNELDHIRASDKVLYLLLKRLDGQKVDNLNARLLSESLVLFTHSVNNFRLASQMVRNATYRTSLSSHVQNTFDKISEEAMEATTKGRLDLIRSANVVPTKKELQNLLKTRGTGSCIREPKLPAEPSKVPPNQLQIRSINIKGQEIQLADYGEAIIEHISNAESFENLITSIAEHWEPDMCKLMLKMTQTFGETTRKEFWIKYHLPTESVLYQIILHTLKRHSSLDYKEVSQALPDILRSVRCYFASCSPNCPPEFLKKCPKCVGYYNEGTWHDDTSDI
ncbi:uncharacterized protein LOC111066558 [Drosophila obscura]|uniref:uncharacterized protein LOC111066558 n=1 Tax=Drosophila obscura TaxID=7282 RepID=UPI001BB27453|nr:uncharacterized protein LOC111066558 [Drosophila obscura]